MIGGSARRVEDPVLLRGRGRFAADSTVSGQLHLRVVRAGVAHGLLRGIDTTAALAVPGVAAVWTAVDVADLPPIDFRLTALDEQRPYRQPVLARTRVRYVGEPVAVVLASSEYVAEDAAELVEVDIDPLPAVLDGSGDVVPWLTAEEASWGAQREIAMGLGSESAEIRLEYGDVAAAFAAAHRVVEVDVTIGRHSGVPLECRGVSARVDPSTGVLVVDGAAKVPFWNRDAIARMIGWNPRDVHLREGHVGGGFGPRGELYPEDVLVPLAAVRLGRPVRWIADRQEDLVSTNHSRDQRHVLRAAVDETGVVTALDGQFWTDQGAYVRTHSATVSSLTASMLPGPYRVASYRVSGRIRMTNKTPAGTYRSPGRYEGTFARERLMDQIANELGLDRLEVRRRNFIPVEEMPYQRPIQAMGTELIYDSGDYALLMDKLEERFELARLRADVQRRRAAGECVGIGYGWFVEKSGLGPYEGAEVEVDTTGAVTVTTGTSSVGQGVDTVLTQVVADVLDVDLDRVRAVRGQTDRFGYGRGAFATRQSVMAGSAVLKAAEAVRVKALTVAAEHFEISPDDLEVVQGGIQVVGNADARISLGEVAALLEPQHANRLGLTPGLLAEEWFHCDHMTYPYGVHVSVVRIDRETGGPTVERYLVGYDVGKALNPTLVEGQITGGVAQGLGGALLEEFRYDEAGQPQASTFMDYLMPTMHEMPPVDVLVTEDAPSPLNPLGIKGAGEGGVTAAAACIASAIDDALQSPGFVTRTPVRPDLIRAHLATTGTHH
ncbi:xanthine dehydrogenase [Intrasporangium chromatireducens Q5-1]|uniref:Xanthine dehydrogenase n=1 Tax=Intrasporangium chromatireducens Q5-1 TaxID=584657 RepID=W9GKR9_9MICO|nr:xanthine dehydrogenase family protein molybdopterin-binding subunit [Intrasporangium chromatireducens]EWT06680.1 xanthine dehydrogenase [Intrasporangium chromatireducens Q5-1]